MSIRWMTRVFDAPMPLGADRLMLLALADNANDQGVCWPSLPTLASKCAVKRRTAIRTLQRLEATGFVRVEREEGKVNRYHLVSKALTHDAYDTGVAHVTRDAHDTPTPDVHVTGTRDARDTPPVTPTSPEPSKNHQLNHQQQPARDVRPLQQAARGQRVVAVSDKDEVLFAQAQSKATVAVEELIRRGVGVSVAEQLVGTSGVQRVREVVDVFDADGRKGVGWLVKALREGWTVRRQAQPGAATPDVTPPRVKGPQTPEEADAWLDGLLGMGGEA